MQPNPFEFASSEILQDAFLSWTFSQADPERGKGRPEIQALGRVFFSALFAKDDAVAPPAEIHSVNVRR
jgi:hypothetical protein